MILLICCNLKTQWRKLAGKQTILFIGTDTDFFRQEVKREICVAEKVHVRTQILDSNGVMYVNTLTGASNTLQFLNFFHEASQFTQPDGNPILKYGDIVLVNNVALHRFDDVQALADWFDSFGVTLVYLPVYSPELYPR